MEFLQRFMPQNDEPFRGVQEPLLTFDESRYWRVYTLTEALEADPRQMELAQALTLNPSKPRMGLKGTFGLFGSPQWWDSINRRKMPLRFISGTIVEAYEAGQDSKTGLNNSMLLELGTGSREHFGIYTNNKKQAKLFVPGATVLMVDALDEYKRPEHNGPESGITLEVVISKPDSQRLG
ncbi:hypothetical protein [Variovorax sp. 160MFSha2.1]|uniref:hypothetical protein n=1 Tax=Variovorax sp. 160MFSha2.1 TaxID=3158367 RepID=UPI003AB07551